MPQSPGQNAAAIRKQTLQTITNALVANNKKINAIKAGTAQGNLDTLYGQRDTLLTTYEEAEALFFNGLNDSQAVRDAIADLKTQSTAANTEAKRLKDVSDSVAKFTALVNNITGIVGGLTGLLT